jgi:hypothetical protein
MIKIVGTNKDDIFQFFLMSYIIFIHLFWNKVKLVILFLIINTQRIISVIQNFNKIFALSRLFFLLKIYFLF